ncbi:hypothetical protein DE146DRAFT_773197 [Phaeosphaeria sp. MPI-PUGE-AT-0046c]|nr:hypothetical protein DE146DRAFT_773197 [Phaeosphaeria sp. MPI-PUGE-AT-0046c]
MPPSKNKSAKAPEAHVPPPPPSTGAFDRAYVHDSLRKIKYIDIQLSKRGNPHPRSTPLSVLREDRLALTAYKDKLRAAKSMLNTHVDDYIDAHFASECRSLLGALHDSLPLEIRETVYESLFSNTRYYLNSKELDWTPDGGTEPRFPPGFIKIYGRLESDSRSTVVFAHVFKPTHVEDIVLRELVAVWYRVSIFDFDDYAGRSKHHVDYISEIMHFFKSDRWGTGHDLRELVRRVRIIFLLPWLQFTSDWPLEMDRPLLEMSHRPLGLDSAMKLKPTTRIRLSVNNLQCLCHNKACLGLAKELPKLYMLFDQLKLLLEHGYTVWISLLNRLEFEVKMEELNEKCWLDKAAAAQALSPIAPLNSGCRSK